ncbi:MAG: carboxypeptidase-like regulatory domain-containing protein [Pseudomonadota bacterium]
MSPTCGGPQRQGLECVSPFAGAQIQLVDGSGTVVASVVTTDQGQFTLRAAPGQYALRVAVGGLYPRCEEKSIRLRKGRIVNADISCDSGMR